MTMRTFIFCFLMVMGGMTFVYGQEVVSDTVNYQNIQFKTKLTPVHYRMDYHEFSGYKVMNIAQFIFSPNIYSQKTQHELIFEKIYGQLSRKKYDKAQQTLNKYKYTLSNPMGYVDAKHYYNLALISKILGKYDLTLNMCHKGITLLEKQLSTRKNKAAGIKISGGRNEMYNYLARFYTLKGETYHLNGSYNNAIEFYEKALMLWMGELGNSVLESSKTLINIGNTYYALGEYEKANIFYNKSLRIRKTDMDEGYRPLAEIYNFKGNIHYTLGDYEKALEFYNKSKKRLRRGMIKRHPIMAQTYMNISNVHYVNKEYKQARDFQEKALQILEKKFGKNHSYTAQSYDQLGSIYFALMDYEKALEYQEKAKQILSSTLKINHPRKAPNYNNLAITKLFIGNYDEAIAYQGIAINITERILGNQHNETIDYKLNLAEMYKVIGKYSSADSLYQIIIPQTIESQNNSYLFLPDEQRMEYLNTVQNIYANFYAFAFAYGSEETAQLAANLLLNTKSLALDYSISFKEIITQMDDEQLTEFSEELTTLNRQLIGVEMSSSGTSKSQQRIASLRQQRDDLTAKLLRNKILKNKLNHEITTWQSLQNQLNDDEAIIDFLVINKGRKKSYCAILTRKTGTPLPIPLTDESVITSILNNKDYIGELSLRKQLYKELWQPLEVHLKEVKTVYLSPSGALHKIPFEALQNDKREYLSEHFQFHYHSSMRDFAKSEPQQATYKDVVLIGHILYDLKDSLEYQVLAMRGDLRDKVTPLKGTLDEVNGIDTICRQANLPTALLTIDEPTEEVIQSLTGDNSPSIYHFATHGVFLNSTDTTDSESKLRSRLRLSSDPLKRSALMLYGANHTWVKGEKILGSGEDGILTALEVTALDLQNTDLVVLSACSTGLGNVHNTEGVFGLQRAFKLAGVNHVVASLWDVDDEATKDLMVMFYENLLVKKQDPATALRHAKDELRNDGYEPENWAGFILIE